MQYTQVQSTSDAHTTKPSNYECTIWI